MNYDLGEGVLDTSVDLNGLEGGLFSARNLAAGAFGVVGGIVGGGLVLAAQAFKGGMDSIFGGFNEVVNSARESQVVTAQLEQVIRSTGGAAGLTAEEIGEMASAMQSASKFTDEQITSAASLMLTFTNIGEEVFPDALTAVLDMSQALGQDLKSSSIQLGKALQAPIMGVNALLRVGVNFSKEAREQIALWVENGEVMRAQKFILEELAVEFGGSAAASVGTMSGEIMVLANQLDNVKERIGFGLMPMMGLFSRTMSRFTLQIYEIIATLVESKGFKEALGFISDLFAKWMGFIEEKGMPILKDFLTNGLGAAIDIFKKVSNLVSGLIDIFVFGETPLGDWASFWNILVGIFGEDLANVIYVVIGFVMNLFEGVKDFIGYIQNITIPILMYWLDVLSVYLQPVFIWISDFVNNTLLPALANLGVWIQDVGAPGFAVWLAEAISTAGEAFVRFADFYTQYIKPIVDALLTGDLGKVWEIIRPVLESAWNGLVTWLQEQIPIFQDMLSDLWDNEIQPRLEEIGTKLTDWIKSQVPVLWERFKKWRESMVNWIDEVTPPLLKKAGEMLGAFTAWLLFVYYPKLVEVLAEVVGLLIAAFLELIGLKQPDANKAGNVLVEGFMKGFAEAPAWQNFKSIWENNWNMLKEIVAQSFMNWTAPAQSFVINFARGVIGGADKIMDAFRFIGDYISFTISGFYGRVYDAGVNLMDGLRQGIIAGIGWIWDAINQVADTIFRVLWDRFILGSASKAFIDIGGYLMAGLNIGALRALPSVLDTMGLAASAVMGAFPVGSVASSLSQFSEMTTNNNFNMVVNSNAPVSSVIDDFSFMRSMVPR